MLKEQFVSDVAFIASEKMAFVDYNKLEALKLIELLTSQRVLVASVDPDRGYVFDFGFVRRAE